MILRCEKCKKNLSHWYAPDEGKDPVVHVKVCKCQERIVKRANDTQPCWYLDDDGATWNIGILYYWSTDYDDDGSYPVGVIEPTSGPMISIYAGNISLGQDKPEKREEKEDEEVSPIEQTIEQTIAEITTRDGGGGHMRVYQLPNHHGQIGKIAVQMEPNAVIILSIGGWNQEQRYLDRAKVQGIAIFRDGEVECDAPYTDIRVLEDIFNASGCKTGRS